MNPAPNLILIGPMGAGKTSIGRRLADRFGLQFTDVDQLIVERCGTTINALFEHVGEAGFREREKAALEHVLGENGRLVSTGGGAVLNPDSRRLMQQRGFVVYLHVGVEAQLKRLGRDRSRPLLQRGDREQVLADLAAAREPLYQEVADLMLDTDALSPSEATTALAQLLAAHWQRSEQMA